MHTVASVAASHLCEAKNSKRNLISLCHPSPVFKCGGWARSSSNTSPKKPKTNKKQNKEIKSRGDKTVQQHTADKLKSNEFKMHVWACLFVCVHAGCESVLVGA